MPHDVARGGSPSIALRLPLSSSPSSQGLSVSPVGHRMCQGHAKGSSSCSSRSASLGAVRSRTLAGEIEQMLVQLDQRVIRAFEADEGKLIMFADETSRLLEGLQALRVSREIHEERRHKNIRMMESTVLLDLSRARQAQAEVEARCEQIINARLFELREVYRRENTAQELVQQQFLRDIVDEVDQLRSLLSAHTSMRGEDGERIVACLDGELQKVHDATVEEQKLRVEAQGSMLKMVDDVHTRILTEIDAERLEREAAQSKFLSVLETACLNLEALVLPHIEPHAPH